MRNLGWAFNDDLGAALYAELPAGGLGKHYVTRCVPAVELAKLPIGRLRYS